MRIADKLLVVGRTHPNAITIHTNQWQHVLIQVCIKRDPMRIVFVLNWLEGDRERDADPRGQSGEQLASNRLDGEIGRFLEHHV